MMPGVESVETDEPQVLGCCKLALGAGRKRERQESGAGSACQGRVRPAEELTWLQLKENTAIGSVVPGVVIAEIGHSSVASKCP